MAQVVLDPERLPPVEFEAAHRIHAEDVLAVRGSVRLRPEGTSNPGLDTGEVEVVADQCLTLARAQPLPFPIDEHAHVAEELRLKYRYLDLRRPLMLGRIARRAALMRSVRRSLDGQGFLEIETPILTRSTPEGARDYLVPSRNSPGSFYALPQSPQLFKQILMVAGFDRYYQIARCFRDEDLRANRQPEFTQLDIEMAFITREDLYAVIEGLMAAIFRDLKGIDLPLPLRRLTHEEAMLRYGSDKPDLRFELPIEDVTDVLRSGCAFKVFTSVMEQGGVVRALRVPGGGERFSTTQLKPGGELAAHVGRFGAKGLAWFRAEGSADGVSVELQSNIAKFFDRVSLARLGQRLRARPGDLILLIADTPATAAPAMGQLRLKLGRDLGLIRNDAAELCWITDFPLFEWDAAEGRWTSVNHPFTAPHPEDAPTLESDPGRVRALAYDLVLNGEEAGGGSIRIHDPNLQRRAFAVLGIDAAQARRRFGFLLEALSYGAPPHGGIAFGLDRLMMQLEGTDSIRDVIPFPKTQTGADLMTDAPAPVDPGQLKELGLRLEGAVERRLRQAAGPPPAPAAPGQAIP